MPSAGSFYPGGFELINSCPGNVLLIALPLATEHSDFSLLTQAHASMEVFPDQESKEILMFLQALSCHLLN